MKKIIIALTAFIGIIGCKQIEEKHTYQGIWRASIALNDSTELPFNFYVKGEDTNMSITIRNGEERITSTKTTKQGDSLKIEFPLFVNYLKLKVEGEQMTGFYINPDAEDYKLPFTAIAKDSNRFVIHSENCCDINKKWATKFYPNTDKEKNAIAYFEQNGNHVTGTFVTETGDYRFLEGSLSENRLQLSTFDGTHLYLFDAHINENQTIEGLFYSGRSSLRPWIAYRDDDFELRNPDSLTFLKPEYKKFEFAFENTNGESLSLDNEQFKDKAIIVQIMGSWCPNCMDETHYLKEVYQQYHNEGLEIIGLTFERGRNKNDGIKRAKKMIRDLKIPYPILMAGYTKSDNVNEILPMLDNFMSFPTSIYLNKNHEVVHIHTGFSGPGTPLYNNFVKENKQHIEQIIYTKDSAEQKL